MRPAVLLLLVTGFALAQGLPKGEGAETYAMVCGGCHGADIVIGITNTREGWADTVQRMRDRGAYGSDADFKVVTDYLARNFAPKSTFAEPEFDHTPAKKRSRWDRFLSVVLPWRWF